jgi:hypothetical protein
VGDEKPKTPIALIIAADEPALFYASVKDAESDLEAIDVRDGVYTAAFGPNGEPYRIGTEGERVVIRATGEVPQPEKLKALLNFYFESTGRKATEDASLSELLNNCTAEDFNNKSDAFAIVITVGVILLIVFFVLKSCS